MKRYPADTRTRMQALWTRVRDGITVLRARLGPGLEPEEPVDDVEGVVKEVLRPVTPTDDFRQSLRSSLDRAEHVRREGISVSDPPPYREGILLGMGATLLAILATMTWLIWRWRARSRAAN